MFWPSRSRPVFVPLILSIALLAGCSRSTSEPLLAGDADGTWGARDIVNFAGESNAHGGDHAYFSFAPGRASDFDVMLAGQTDMRAMRIVVGPPESFFGRTAVPWVYQAVPGEPSDSTFLDLRQYWSVSPAGELLFHGAQNKGTMQFYEPPLRVLPAKPKGGEVFRDTVVLQSFLPGIGLFDSATVVFETKISERTALRLPAGNIQAFRANQTAIDIIRPRMRGDADGEGNARQRDDLDVLKGFWFARRRGIVARDYPFGAGPTNTNIRTYALRAEGTAPVPLPEPAP